MKITAVKTFFADGGQRVFVFVKVETDQPGLVGWGEASLEAKPRAVAGCVADMEPMIVGEDPRRIEYIWQILYRGAFWRQGVIGMSAISGIDQALWDIKRKDLGNRSTSYWVARCVIKSVCILILAAKPQIKPLRVL